MNSLKPYRVMSLFSGAGGADLGFINNNQYNILYSNDNNSDCLATHLANSYFDGIPRDHRAIQYVSNVFGLMELKRKLTEIHNIPPLEPTFDIIIGGPPCQSFSKARTTASTTWQTCSGLENVKSMQQIVDFFKPKMFICENITTVLGPSMLAAYTVFMYGWTGYTVKPFVLNTEYFGIPQRRERVFFVGIRTDIVKRVGYNFNIINRDKGHWRHSTDGWSDYLNCYFSDTSNAIDNDYVLLKRSNSKEEIRWNQSTPTITTADRFVIKRSDISETRKGLHVNARCFNSNDWRYISTKEMAALQGFPKDFVFYGNTQSVMRQIGNAWSVPVSIALAEESAQCLSKSS
jgi:DNA (cytosine-5)-methyltransferase 1